ncbi:MAG TPA: hypothetical protein VGM88_30280 [Kofleriaceae bacterium]|jgi:hypothetical protein
MRALALAAVVAACTPPGAPPHEQRPASPVERQVELVKLTGGWRWILRTQADGTTRVERENWRFEPQHGAATLAGRYTREVEVRSDDGTPFTCNQRPWYRMRAVFDLTAALDANGRDFVVRETAVTAEPSPCDHGFRTLGSYHGSLSGDRLALTWSGGTQTLWKTDDSDAPLPEQPWHDPPLAGAWRWDSTSVDEAGNLREEHEWWELTAKSPTTMDATYRRRVTVRSRDGSPIACAAASSWTFDDAYVLDGQREEEHWHFHELAVDPGDHPCLRPTPHRALDEATAEQIGDFLVLEWRGKRRQILYRAE